MVNLKFKFTLTKMTIKIEKVIYQRVLYMPTIIRYTKFNPTQSVMQVSFCAIIGKNVAKMWKMCFWIQFSDWILHYSTQHLLIVLALQQILKVATIMIKFYFSLDHCCSRSIGSILFVNLISPI